MNIRVLIVDDEPLARARLNRLLKQINAVEVVGEAVNGQDAISMIDAVSPNLVLMDVQMPAMNGIDAAKHISEQFAADPPAIVFCTAYDRYAIDAFKANASDYLLKPVSIPDLEDAIKRACRVSQLNKVDQLSESDYLTIKHTQHVEKLPVKNINYFRSEEKYVVAGLLENREILIDLTLKELEHKFSSSFVRVHRNSLVSKSKLNKLVRNTEGDYVELTDCDKAFVVSRRMLHEVKKCFE